MISLETYISLDHVCFCALRRLRLQPPPLPPLPSSPVPSLPSSSLHSSHQVLESGRAVCLKYLLDCGGNANMADKRGYTPLHMAAQLGNVEAATLLLERDARIDAVEKVCVCVCVCV